MTFPRYSLRALFAAMAVAAAAIVVARPGWQIVVGYTLVGASIIAAVTTIESHVRAWRRNRATRRDSDPQTK